MYTLNPQITNFINDFESLHQRTTLLHYLENRMSRSHINFNALADDGWLVTLHRFFCFFLRIDDKQMEDLWGYIQYKSSLPNNDNNLMRKKGRLKWKRPLCFFFKHSLSKCNSCCEHVCHQVVMPSHDANNDEAARRWW